MSQKPLNFSSFRTSFTSNVSALKRRFSSGDLEHENDDPQPEVGQSSTSPGVNPGVVTQQPVGTSVAAAPPTSNPMSKTTSAPTSPSRSTSSTSIFQRLQNVTGVAREVTSNITSQVISTVSGNQYITPSKVPFKDPNTLILLVIDEPNTDWSKYFRGRKANELEIRVEQCEFSELSVVSFESYCIATYTQYREGLRQLRQFQPDFLLIRQNLRDAGRDYKNMLLALMYGGLFSVNSLPAIYNFQDKPWVFAHMVNLQRKIGRDNFPLIEQNFYPDFQNMNTFVPKLPSVLKIGHAHGGLGKIRTNSLHDYQDASSVVAVTGTYSTSEPYVEARCDVHIQKIGNQYKAFMRKGIVGHWKSGSGSAMLEQIPLTDRHRSWVDNVATLFGGLDICALEVLIGKDGREWIIEVNDSALTLMGETQEEDRRHIADLVMSRMGMFCKVPLGITPPPTTTSQPRYTRRPSEDNPASSLTSQSNQPDQQPNTSTSPRRDSQGSATSSISSAATGAASAIGNKLFSRQNSQQLVNAEGGGTGTGTGQDTEDTMKNLRKTFAGIFGEM